MTLLGDTTPSQSDPWSNGNEKVLRISQSPNIIEASPSDCSMSYPGHLWGESYPIYRDAVGIFYSSSLLSWIILVRA